MYMMFVIFEMSNNRPVLGCMPFQFHPSVCASMITPFVSVLPFILGSLCVPHMTVETVVLQWMSLVCMVSTVREEGAVSSSSRIETQELFATGIPSTLEPSGLY
jgi:hypothetical protein